MRTWLAGADWIKEQGEVEVKEIFRIKKKEEKKSLQSTDGGLKKKDWWGAGTGGGLMEKMSFKK